MQVMGPCWKLGIFAIIFAWGSAHASAQGDSAKPKDYTGVSLESLDIQLVPAEKDGKTGFILAGQNPTPLLKTLTELNGRTIAELEKDMRPGAKSAVGSNKGFLGADEKLLDILVSDNKYVVDELKLTHQELAKHLHILGALAIKEKDKEIVYQGRRFKVTSTMSRGIQLSPFMDDTKTNVNAMIHNLENDKKLMFSRLVPHMIERYGFYEGKGTPYRVEPRNIIAVLDFLVKKK